MPHQEQIIETKSCRHCSTSFEITDRDMDFYDKVSPIIGGIKYTMPTPTLCPNCRQQRRLSFRNERHLYKRKCDASGKDIISIYSPNKPHKVYDQKIRRSDAWDAMDYGREFDFGRTFTEQFGTLMKEVPRINLATYNNENADFNNFCGGSKNCYMTFASSNNQNCFFGRNTSKSFNTTDALSVYEMQDCYQCISSNNLSSCRYLTNSSNCFSCISSDNIHGCSFCIGSRDITNKKYVIYGKQSDKETFDSLYASITAGYLTPNKENLYITNCENVTGKYINDSKDSHHIFDSRNIVNSKYIYGSYKNNDSFDQTYCDNELGYECLGGSGYNSLFACPINGQYNIYSISCFDSSYIFGCIGLRNKSYCIFNKQYTKEQYEELVAKIIMYMQTTSERGEFFHPSLSPFGYNETVAMEYFPILPPPSHPSYHLSTYTAPIPNIDQIIHGKDLPSSIQDIDDSILKVAIRCEVSDKLFLIIPQELAFYRKHTIPLPKRHPDQRHKERMELRK